MAGIVEVPTITRVRASGQSKYVPDGAVTEVAALLLQHQGTQWIGDIVEPVDTLVKARTASRKMKEALSEYMDKPTEQFKVRVFTKGGTPQNPLYTYALALQAEPEPESESEPTTKEK